MLATAQNIHASSAEVVRPQEPVSRILSGLGRSLNGAGTVRRAAEIILEAADAMLGWDAASLDLYSQESDAATGVLAMDLVEGRRTEITPAPLDTKPSPTMRQVINDGAQLLLRDSTPQFGPELERFGDMSRPSASLLFVPLRGQSRVLGVLTIQSYTPEAYAREDLDALQALADYCAGAIERIQTEGLLRRTEELYRRAIGGAGAVPYAYDYRSRSYSFMGEGIEQLTGYSPKRSTAKSGPASSRNRPWRAMRPVWTRQEAARRVETGELRHWRCDMRILTREGKSRWLSDASVQNLDEAGRVIGSMGILEDITERKQAELSALALSKLGQSLISATTQDEAARVLLQVANELFSWDACAFYLYSAEQDAVHPVLYMDTIDGQRVEVAPPNLDGKPSPINRRVIEEGAAADLERGAGWRWTRRRLPLGTPRAPRLPSCGSRSGSGPTRSRASWRSTAILRRPTARRT